MIPTIWKEFRALQTSMVTVLFHFMTPLFLLVFFATVMGRNLSSFVYAGASVDYIDFFTPGLVGYATFMTFQLALTFVRHDRMSGMLGIIILCRSNLSGYVSGKLVAQLVINLLKVAALIALSMLLSGTQVALFQPANLIGFVLALAFGSTVWLGLGLATALVLSRDDIREVLTMFVSMPLVFASSMYYDISRAPAWIQAIARVNPLTYTCNLTREAYLLPDMNLFSTDLGILACMAVGAMALAVFVSGRLDY